MILEKSLELISPAAICPSTLPNHNAINIIIIDEDIGVIEPTHVVTSKLTEKNNDCII